MLILNPKSKRIGFCLHVISYHVLYLYLEHGAAMLDESEILDELDCEVKFQGCQRTNYMQTNDLLKMK